MRDWLTIELILATLLVSSYTCVGLLALWAATSPRHWFVRTAVVLGVLSTLLLIPAYEPFVAFATLTAIVLVGTPIYRRWHPRRTTVESESPPSNPLRFSLLTVLLLTVLVAVAVAIAIRLPTLNVAAWSSVALNGVSGGLATVIGAWMYVTRRRFITWPGGILLCLIIGILISRYDWFFPSVTTIWYGWPPDDSGAAALLGVADRPWLWGEWFMILTLAAISVVVVLMLWNAGFAGPARTRLMRWTARAVLAGTLCALAALPLYVLAKLLTPDPIPVTNVPEPNAYDDFIAAGKIIDATALGGSLDIETATAQQLVPEVDKCDTAYELITAALRMPCAAPVDYSLSADSMPMEDLMYMRDVTRALWAKGRLAELEGRYADAVECYRQAVRVGYAIRRDGLLIHALVGIACSGIGMQPLYHLRSKLPPDQLDQCIALLVELDGGDEPYADVWQRDRVWSQRANGWHGHLQQLLGELVDHVYDVFFLSSNQYEPSYWMNHAKARLLAVDLALVRFWQDHGHWPAALSELVPTYLSAIPIDPFDPHADPLRFRLIEGEGEYVLYSVGPNRVDDDGRVPDDDALPGLPQTGDIRLDRYFAP